MTRRRLQPEQRREELLDATFAILLTDGIEGLSMEALAAQAGANKALPYHYFGSREGVLVALADREYTKLLDEFRAARDRGTGREDQLRSIMESWIAADARRDVLAALDGAQSRTGELDATLQAHTKRIAEFFCELLTQEARLDRATALLLAGALVSSSRGLLSAWQRTPWSRKRVIDLWMKVWLGALDAVADEFPRTADPAVKPPPPPEHHPPEPTAPERDAEVGFD